MNKIDIESRSVQVNGRRAHYLKAGSGPPVVLIHGGASDAQDWISTMTALSDPSVFTRWTCSATARARKMKTVFILPSSRITWQGSSIH